MTTKQIQHQMVDSNPTPSTIDTVTAIADPSPPSSMETHTESSSSPSSSDLPSTHNAAPMSGRKRSSMTSPSQLESDSLVESDSTLVFHHPSSAAADSCMDSPSSSLSNVHSDSHEFVNTNKKQRIIASTPSYPLSASSSSSSTSMEFLERFIYRDSDSITHILSMLGWSCIAALANTNQSIRTFFLNTQRIVSSDVEANVSGDSQIDSLIPAKWVHRHIKQMNLTIRDIKPLPLSFYLLSMLSQLTGLTLDFELPSMCSAIFHSLSILNPGLISLEIFLSDRTQTTDEQLRQEIRSASFAFLRRMPTLQKFSFDTALEFYCTKQQVDDILCCPSLQTLLCGNFLGSHQEGNDLNRSRPEWIRDGVARLHQLPNLQCLYMTSNEFLNMEADIWPHLTKCKSLTAVDALMWSEDIDQDWRLLLNFKQLARLSISPPSPVEVRLPLRLVEVLVSCQSIRVLMLDYVILTKDHLARIVAELPQLDELMLRPARLESLSALAYAAGTLTKLVFNRCSDLNGEMIAWPVVLPVMPHILECTINERWFSAEPVSRAVGVANIYVLALTLKFPNAQSIHVSLADSG